MCQLKEEESGAVFSLRIIPLSLPCSLYPLGVWSLGRTFRSGRFSGSVRAEMSAEEAEKAAVPEANSAGDEEEEWLYGGQQTEQHTHVHTLIRFMGSTRGGGVVEVEVEGWVEVSSL